jgi:hypothetical protein
LIVIFALEQSAQASLASAEEPIAKVEQELFFLLL